MSESVALWGNKPIEQMPNIVISIQSQKLVIFYLLWKQDFHRFRGYKGL